MSQALPELFCYLGMPGYGHLTAGAAASFFHATRRSQDAIRWENREGSLLANNFNQLWVNALNIAHGGRKVRYFAMQHADIQAERYWLDKLVDELEAKDLDVLGVVAPIKDSRGVTSIALAHPSGDPWRIHTRLTMREVYRLPETFTSEDVGHPILLNTGLWVCRFNMDWAPKVHFTINDEIVFNTKTGQYQALCESEDWFFSRLLHELGLKVGCTRKVGMKHRGETDYLNTHPWGSEDFDSAHLSETVIPSDGFVFPADVDGWLSHTEGRALWQLARGKRVLEVGSYCGASTICLAQSARLVTAIDPFDGRGTPRPRPVLDEFRRNIERYGLGKKLTSYVGTLEEWRDEIGGPYDLIFIDGAHDMESVRSDIDNARSLLTPGGILLFHDYAHCPDHPGVKRAVDELLASGGELVSVHDSLAVVRPPALALSEV